MTCDRIWIWSVGRSVSRSVGVDCLSVRQSVNRQSDQLCIIPAGRLRNCCPFWTLLVEQRHLGSLLRIVRSTLHYSSGSIRSVVRSGRHLGSVDCPFWTSPRFSVENLRTLTLFVGQSSVTTNELWDFPFARISEVIWIQILGYQFSVHPS